MKRSHISYSKIKEFEHGLFGVGEIEYIYNPIGCELSIYINGKFHRIFRGDKAKKIHEKATGDITSKELLTISNYKHIACEVCGVENVNDLNQKKRDDNIVFARYFCWWVAVKKLKMTFMDAGLLFNMDHTSAHRAVNIIETGIDSNGKSIKPHQLGWKIKFIKRIQAIEDKLS
jgi:hypothetical protein